MYARGQAVSADQTEALRLYQLSAAQGNGEGMNAVAYKYQYGTGVAVDISQAVQWYCKAVERGNARALNNLALLYLHGLGVPQSFEVARDLWNQSAERGHANAMYNLGMSYLGGPGVRDAEQGTKLVTEAALHGHAQAQQLLRNNGYKGQLPPPSDEAAIMTIQSPPLPPGHAPACGKATPQS
jgi:TPR repeat protein